MIIRAFDAVIASEQPARMFRAATAMPCPPGATADGTETSSPMVEANADTPADMEDNTTDVISAMQVNFGHIIAVSI